MRLYFWLKDLFRTGTFGSLRSNQWSRVRAEWLKLHPTCAVCGGNSKISVHHKLPFAKFPNLELDKRNFITLCESKKYGVQCHLWFGHFGNYAKNYNSDIEEDCEIWHQKFKNG